MSIVLKLHRSELLERNQHCQQVDKMSGHEPHAKNVTRGIGVVETEDMTEPRRVRRG